MRMRQPLVLLLGGIISASSAGCATWNAVVSETTSRPGSRKASAERMVSIARVFENQGQFDQAEVMYRKALRLNPQDDTLKDQLAQLAERRSTQEFQADPTTTAIARADSINGRNTRQSHSRTTSNDASSFSSIATVDLSRSTPSTIHDGIRLTASHPTASPQVTTANVADLQSEKHAQSGHARIPEIRVVPGNVYGQTPEHWIDTAPIPPVELLSVDRTTTEPSSIELEPVDQYLESGPPGLAEVLAAADEPNQHTNLLMQAAQGALTTEAQGLAATLLGECDPRDQAIRDCLASVLNHADDHGVLLAAADSQIQRGEADQRTARQLAMMAADPASSYQIQAATSLMHFAGTSTHAACADALVGLLVSQNPKVRASAAATLGDFADSDSTVLTALTELAAEDPDENVREAAKSAIARRTVNDERAEAVIIVPAQK